MCVLINVYETGRDNHAWLSHFQNGADSDKPEILTQNFRAVSKSLKNYGWNLPNDYLRQYMN